MESLSNLSEKINESGDSESDTHYLILGIVVDNIDSNFNHVIFERTLVVKI